MFEATSCIGHYDTSVVPRDLKLSSNSNYIKKKRLVLIQLNGNLMEIWV